MVLLFLFLLYKIYMLGEVHAEILTMSYNSKFEKLWACVTTYFLALRFSNVKMRSSSIWTYLG